MKLSMLDQMRVWAAVTGLVLVLWFFVSLYIGIKSSPTLPMLVSAIGGSSCSSMPRISG